MQLYYELLISLKYYSDFYIAWGPPQLGGPGQSAPVAPPVPHIVYQKALAIDTYVLN